MADPLMLVLLNRQNRRALRRNRVFRDRINPLDKFDDVEIFSKFRFRRADILRIVDDMENELRHANRLGSLIPSLQVCLTLRFYASGGFQDVCGELINISQSTASRTITRVTNALRRIAPNWIRFPDQAEADRQKQKFREIAGFPHVVGCVDGTHVEIQAPPLNEHEYVNRKGRHSINVMVITNADLMFIGVSARWPGSVHDARVMRESAIFPAFEGLARPVQGYILADSGYMLRSWLLTPVLNPRNQQQRDYNDRHTSTRYTVERTIGIAKKRWHCLNKLRVDPHKACDIIIVCLMLHNRARALNLPEPDSDDDSDDDNDDDQLSLSLLMNIFVLLQERLRGKDSSMLDLIIKARRFFIDEECNGGASEARLPMVCMSSVTGPSRSSPMVT